MKQATKQTQALPMSRAPRVTKEVRAEAFILVDSQSRVRAELKTVQSVSGSTSTTLALHDEEGRLRATLRDDWQEASLNFFSEVRGETQEVLMVGYRPNIRNTLEPCLTITDSTGSDRIALRASEGQDARLVLTDPDTTQLVINPEGLAAWDNKGNLALELSKSEAGKAVTTPAKPLTQATKLTDPQAEMEAAIDKLLQSFEQEVKPSEFMTELMLLLHIIAVQPDMGSRDCLDFAVARCYYWTTDAETARDTYLARLLQAQPDRAPGQEMRGGGR